MAGATMGVDGVEPGVVDVGACCYPDDVEVG